MKKALSVTLNETVFQIEEDAYLKLDKYLASIKEYYKPDEGAEIIFDIEASLAEKFAQKTEKGSKVITLKDVEAAIAVMGTVNEFEENIAEDINLEKDISLDNETKPKFKKLFRNPNDAILGGVCSGIAAYFGTSPLLIRILFIIFSLFPVSGVLIYIILWVIIPPAKTSAQKLEMQGKPVNLEEIQELVRENSKKIKAEGKNIIENVKKNKGNLYKILSFPVKVLELLFIFLKKFGFWFIVFFSVFLGIALLISFSAAILGLTVSFGVLLFNINSPYIISDIPLAEFTNSAHYYVGLVSAYLFFLVPLIFLVILSLAMIKRKNYFSQIFSIVLVTIWILAATGFAISTADIVPRLNDYIIKNEEKEKITRQYDFKDFSKLNISGNNLKVNIIQGNESKVEITGTVEDLNRLITVSDKGELTIKRSSRNIKGKWCLICLKKDLTATITVPKLEAVKGAEYADIEMTGFLNNIYLELNEYSKLDWKNIATSSAPYSLDVNLNNFSNLTIDNIKADQIKISQKAYSTVKLTGQANALNAELLDFSKLDGAGLNTKEAIIKSANYSDIELGAVDSIQATARHFSHITYGGQPSVVNVDKHDYSEITNRGNKEQEQRQVPEEDINLESVQGPGQESGQ